MLMNWYTIFSPVRVRRIFVREMPGQMEGLLNSLAAATVAGLAVFAVSISSAHESGGTPSDFWNQYLWGPGGYDGEGMTLKKALIRMSGVNIIAWLPLAGAGFALWFRNGLGPRYETGRAAVLRLHFYGVWSCEATTLTIHGVRFPSSVWGCSF